MRNWGRRRGDIGDQWKVGLEGALLLRLDAAAAAAAARAAVEFVCPGMLAQVMGTSGCG